MNAIWTTDKFDHFCDYVNRFIFEVSHREERAGNYRYYTTLKIAENATIEMEAQLKNAGSDEALSWRFKVYFSKLRKTQNNFIRQFGNPAHDAGKSEQYNSVILSVHEAFNHVNRYLETHDLLPEQFTSIQKDKAKPAQTQNTPGKKPKAKIKFEDLFTDKYRAHVDKFIQVLREHENPVIDEGLNKIGEAGAFCAFIEALLNASVISKHPASVYAEALKTKFAGIKKLSESNFSKYKGFKTEGIRKEYESTFRIKISQVKTSISSISSRPGTSGN